MMRRLPDFKKRQASNESWYDLYEDWALIEASIAKQYGIRIRQHSDMPWDEFCALVGGIMPDTPLGQVVAIRSENDPKAIKSFNADQKRIHREWRKRQAQMKMADPEQLDKEMEAFSKMFAAMFGKK